MSHQVRSPRGQFQRRRFSSANSNKVKPSINNMSRLLEILTNSLCHNLTSQNWQHTLPRSGESALERCSDASPQVGLQAYSKEQVEYIHDRKKSSCKRLHTPHPEGLTACILDANLEHDILVNLSARSH